jgi:hypothetical protein
MQQPLALSSLALCLALIASPALADPPSARSSQQMSASHDSRRGEDREQRDNGRAEVIRQARQFAADQGACPAGQVAPGHSASAPGSPFNPDGNAGRHNSDRSHFQNGCHEGPASP